MRKSLGLFLFITLFLISHPIHAGHDFMEAMRQGSALTKEESCSNGQTKIEHRLVRGKKAELSLTLVILEPDATSQKSQFYSEKIFYSLIFYKMSDIRDMTKASYLMKKVQSGNLEKLTASQWLKEIHAADPNAAKSLTKQSGSDCKITFEATVH